jgi:hypothetical protein
MRPIKDLKTVAYSGSAAPYDGEFFSQPISKVGFKFDGSVTASGGGAVSGQLDDAAHRLVGVFEVAQAGESLIRMDARDIKHLQAIVSGGYGKRIETTPSTSATDKLMCEGDLDLSRMLPGAMIDSRSERVVITGSFRDSDQYASTNLSAISATLRPRVGAIPEAPPASYWRPRFTQKSVRVESASDLDNTTFQHPRDVLVLGYLIRQYDNSANARVDGLLRKLRAEFAAPGREAQTLVSTTWGALRQETSRSAGFALADHDEAEGVALLAFGDPTRGERGLTMPAGSAMTLWFDTSATVEGEFDAVTAGSGDQLVITELAFERIQGAGARPSGTRVSRVPAAAARRRMGR